jgi:type III secretory pathway component EscV
MNFPKFCNEIFICLSVIAKESSTKAKQKKTREQKRNKRKSQRERLSNERASVVGKDKKKKEEKKLTLGIRMWSWLPFEGVWRTPLRQKFSLS